MPSAISLACLFASTLAATIAIELPLAFALFGVRGRRRLAVVALAQVATNPVVEFVCLVVRWRASMPLLSSAWAVMLGVEVAATMVEALLYRTAAVTQHPWRMSCALNLISFCVGLLLSS